MAYQAKITRKLFQTGKYSYVVTIPKDIVRHIGWQRGDTLEMDLDSTSKRLIIKKFTF